jgi:hypothetical protein
MWISRYSLLNETINTTPHDNQMREFDDSLTLI